MMFFKKSLITFIMLSLISYNNCEYDKQIEVCSGQLNLKEFLHDFSELNFGVLFKIFNEKFITPEESYDAFTFNYMDTHETFKNSFEGVVAEYATYLLDNHRFFIDVETAYEFCLKKSENENDVIESLTNNYFKDKINDVNNYVDQQTIKEKIKENIVLLCVENIKKLGMKFDSGIENFGFAIWNFLNFKWDDDIMRRDISNFKYIIDEYIYVDQQPIKEIVKEYILSQISQETVNIKAVQPITSKEYVKEIILSIKKQNNVMYKKDLWCCCNELSRAGFIYHKYNTGIYDYRIIDEKYRNNCENIENNDLAKNYCMHIKEKYTEEAEIDNNKLLGTVDYCKQLLESTSSSSKN